MAARDLATARALDTRDTARLLAMVNTVSADALMSVLNAKYQFLFWRPVTAIAGAGVCPTQPSAVTADGFGPVPGFDDGNPATVEDPCWRPLVTTPNHPEYPAAHGTNTSAMAEVFSEFLGTDQIDLDIRGFDPPASPETSMRCITSTRQNSSGKRSLTPGSGAASTTLRPARWASISDRRSRTTASITHSRPLADSRGEGRGSSSTGWCGRSLWGGGAPYRERSSVVCASPTRIVS